MKKNRVFQRGMALLLLLALAAGWIPDASGTFRVNAADGDKAIAGLGADAVANPIPPKDTDSPWAGSYVYFGTYKGNPVKYRVLHTKAADFGKTTMLLDCDSILWYGTAPNNWYHESTNKWEESEIKKYLNNGRFLNHSFSAMEQNAIAQSEKTTVGSTDGKGYFHLNYAPLSGEKIFLLDAAEATNTSYGYSDTSGLDASRKKTGGNKQWWLRSDEDETGDQVGFVFSSGNIGTEPVNNFYPEEWDFVLGVSPAFNLNLPSILFSSVIAGTAGQIGAEYKLTLLDHGMNIAIDGEIAKNGDAITIPYTISGGSATQVSVLILDKEYTPGNDNHANVLAYEKLKMDGFSKSGTGTFLLPADLSGKVCGIDYYAYLVAEEVNGEKETDYASKPAAIDIPRTKKINSVQVVLDNPAAGHAFDTTAECSAEGIESVSAAWEDADGQPVNGNADYNSIYTLKLTIAPAEGYVLDAATFLQLNDGSRNVENITWNPDDGTLRGTVTFQTGKAKLLSILQPAPITGIANGTKKAAEAFGLPDTVAIETEDTDIATAAVAWKVEEITQEQYDPSIRNKEQVFTVNGTVTLPGQIDNPKGISLEVSIDITVLAAGFAGKPIASPAEGTYTENQSVTLRSSTQDAEIYYTTDDVTPDQANGIRYTGAVSVTGLPGKSVTTTIRAVAVKEGMHNSETAVFTYIMNLPALKYAVTVRNGTGSGEYQQGQTVAITADVLEGKQFQGWNVEKGSVILADSNDAATTFTMPTEDVSIAASYADTPSHPDEPKELEHPDMPDGPKKPKHLDMPEGQDDKNNLDTLPKGKHTLEILWTGGSAKTAFTIWEAEETEENSMDKKKSPKTGE